MPDHTVTVSQGKPTRRWTKPVAITLSDVNADANLQTTGGVPYRFLQNVGTSGLVNIFWDDGTTVDIYLSQGEVIEGGRWQHARTTGTAAGVALRGFVGMPGVGL